MPIISKLALGTAKLGLPEYGHSDGGVLNDPVDFLLRSIDRGIKSIDTSPRYGNSEELIGEALKQCNKKPIISRSISI